MGDNEEEGISVLYRQEVLGKDVWIKFGNRKGKQRFCKGVVTKCMSYFPNHDTSKPLEYLHHVHFGDSDDNNNNNNEDDEYYDLTDKEETGNLKWSNNDEDDEDRAATRHTAVVTPEKRSADPTPPNNNDGTTTTTTTARRPPRKRPKIKIKLEEFGTTISNIDNPNNNIINHKEFENWLRNIHKGSGGDPISESNVKRTMERARDLVCGDGIGYRNWPQNVRIYCGKTVDLNTNFDDLIKEGKMYERRYERDKGNGWLFAHPIKKLILYKEYVQQKRNERANPTVLD